MTDWLGGRLISILAKPKYLPLRGGLESGRLCCCRSFRTRMMQTESMAYHLATLLSFKEKLAGVVGFEPTHDGVRVHCLTTWRHPSKTDAFIIRIPEGFALLDA